MIMTNIWCTHPKRGLPQHSQLLVSPPRLPWRLHDVDDGVDVDGNGDNSPTLLLHVMILFILRSKKQIRLNGVKLQFCDLSNKWDISRLRLNVRSSRFFCDKISAIESIASCLTRVLQEYCKEYYKEYYKSIAKSIASCLARVLQRVLQRVLHLVLQLHRVLHSLQFLAAGVESLLTAIEVSLNGDCRFVHVGICLNDTSCLFQTEWRN